MVVMLLQPTQLTLLFVKHDWSVVLCVIPSYFPFPFVNYGIRLFLLRAWSCNSFIGLINE
jgi:hypothetical protein